VFVLDADQDRAELVRQCLTVGYERLSGELNGGIDAWRAGGRETARIPLVDPSQLRGTIVDVRQRVEYESGHVPGAVHIELGSLWDTPVPEGSLTVMCGHGERAMTGASVLETLGRHDLVVLAGGPTEWCALAGSALDTGA
jgi:rhodanese-related sulfurtransferase